MEETGWLLLLYSLPTKRGTARVGIWRQLKKSGALPFQTSGYLLPNRAELMERFQWLAQQVRDAGGEATLARVSEVEGLSREEIIRQFSDARAKDYAVVAALLNDLIASRDKREDTLLPELEKLRRQFAEVRRIDYFGCARAQEVARLLERAASVPTRGRRGKKPAILSPRRFAGKTWVTRPHPEIDRVGSAWLIRRFIDAKARFVFAEEPALHSEAIPYDMVGVEFTHHGDDCTFETLLSLFDLSDKPLRKLGEMIHDADLEDGKFQTPDAIGLDRVLKGWALLGLSDDEILARGSQCFDAFYAFLKART